MNLTESPILKFDEKLKESEKAYQIKFSQTDICWLPKSQTRITGNHIYIAEWLVKEKNLKQYQIVGGLNG